MSHSFLANDIGTAIVVDDSEISRPVMSRKLHEAAAQLGLSLNVAEAEDAEDAAHIIRDLRQSVSLILTDLNMLGRNGLGKNGISMLVELCTPQAHSLHVSDMLVKIPKIIATGEDTLGRFSLDAKRQFMSALAHLPRGGSHVDGLWSKGIFSIPSQHELLINLLKFAAVVRRYPHKNLTALSYADGDLEKNKRLTDGLDEESRRIVTLFRDQNRELLKTSGLLPNMEAFDQGPQSRRLAPPSRRS